jgi:hypothetical protein
LHLGGADRWLGRALPLPLLGGLFLAYAMTVFYPVLRSASLARSALQAGALFLEQREQRFPQMRNPPLFLKERVIKPLIEAAREDSLDAHRRTQAAFWYGKLWEALLIDARLKGLFNPRAPLRKGLELEDEMRLYGAQALAAVRDAEKWDPSGKEAYLIDAELHRSFAERAVQGEKRKQQFALAAKALRQLAEVDPTSARVHYDLAVMLFAAGDPVEGRAAAREARRLDGLTHPQRQLTLVQRRQLKEWLDKGD